MSVAMYTVRSSGPQRPPGKKPPGSAGAQSPISGDLYEICDLPTPASKRGSSASSNVAVTQGHRPSDAPLGRSQDCGVAVEESNQCADDAPLGCSQDALHDESSEESEAEKAFIRQDCIPLHRAVSGMPHTTEAQGMAWASRPGPLDLDKAPHGIGSLGQGIAHGAQRPLSHTASLTLAQKQDQGCMADQSWPDRWSLWSPHAYSEPSPTLNPSPTSCASVTFEGDWDPRSPRQIVSASGTPRPSHQPPSTGQDAVLLQGSAAETGPETSPEASYYGHSKRSPQGRQRRTTRGEELRRGTEFQYITDPAGASGSSGQVEPGLHVLQGREFEAASSLDECKSYDGDEERGSGSSHAARHGEVSPPPPGKPKKGPGRRLGSLGEQDWGFQKDGRPPASPSSRRKPTRDVGPSSRASSAKAGGASVASEASAGVNARIPASPSARSALKAGATSPGTPSSRSVASTSATTPRRGAPGPTLASLEHPDVHLGLAPRSGAGLAGHARQLRVSVGSLGGRDWENQLTRSSAEASPRGAVLQIGPSAAPCEAWMSTRGGSVPSTTLVSSAEQRAELSPNQKGPTMNTKDGGGFVHAAKAEGSRALVQRKSQREQLLRKVLVAEAEAQMETVDDPEFGYRGVLSEPGRCNEETSMADMGEMSPSYERPLSPMRLQFQDYPCAGLSSGTGDAMGHRALDLAGRSWMGAARRSSLPLERTTSGTVHPSRDPLVDFGEGPHGPFSFGPLGGTGGLNSRPGRRGAQESSPNRKRAEQRVGPKKGGMGKPRIPLELPQGNEFWGSYDECVVDTSMWPHAPHSGTPSTPLSGSCSPMAYTPMLLGGADNLGGMAASTRGFDGFGAMSAGDVAAFDMETFAGIGSLRGERFDEYVLGVEYRDIRRRYALRGSALGTNENRVIRKCKDRFTGETLVCKSIDKRGIRKPENADDIRKEVSCVMLVQGHPGVVCFRDAFEDESHVHIITELCRGGDLSDRIVKKGHLEEKSCAFICETLVRALLHCHSLGIVHRDVKPDNILLVSKSLDANVKLVDFGSSAFFKPGEKLEGLAGTLDYMAPEVLEGSYGPKADVWSLGVVLYVALCGEQPFWADSLTELVEKIKQGYLKFSQSRWSEVSNSAKDLVAKMLCTDPDARIELENILHHPWMHEHCSLLS